MLVVYDLIIIVIIIILHIIGRKFLDHLEYKEYTYKPKKKNKK